MHNIRLEEVLQGWEKVLYSLLKYYKESISFLNISSNLCMIADWSGEVGTSEVLDANVPLFMFSIVMIIEHMYTYLICDRLNVYHLMSWP